MRRYSCQRRLRIAGEAADVDLAFTLSRLGDVVAVLHAHEGIHGDAEGLFDAQGHFRGEGGAFVEQRGESRAGDAEDAGGVRHGETVGVDDLVLDEAARVGGVLHADAGCGAHGFLLVIVFVVEVDDLDLIAVDAEREAPVPGDEEAPGALSVAGELMGLPGRNGADFFRALHVLQEGDHASQLRDHRGGEAAAVVSFDEAPQSLVDHVPDLHERSVSNNPSSVKRRFTPNKSDEGARGKSFPPHFFWPLPLSRLVVILLV